MNFLLFLIVDHVWENLVCLLELRVWFVNLLFAFETMYIDNMYLTFKMCQRNVPTRKQFDCTIIDLSFKFRLFYYKKKKTLIGLS